MKKFLKKLINSGNREVEAHLVLLGCGVVTLIALATYHVVVLHNAFDPLNYGQGLGWMLGGGGVAAVGQGMQRHSEKGGEDESAE